MPRDSRFISVAALFVALCFGTCSSRAADGAPGDFKAAILPLLEKHCVACHGADMAEASLRLDTLAPEFASPLGNQKWTKILDKIASGEMPPKDEPPLAEAEKSRLVGYLHAQLLAAERSNAPQPGTLSLRRLNRLQYENTIHDLLGIETELQSYLPEDKRAFGFDNIGSALSLSSAQIEAYLEAADVALDAAIVTRAKPPLFKSRLSGVETIGYYEARAHRAVLEFEDAAVGFGRLSFYAMREPPPEDGLYRVRISAFGYQSLGKPVEMYVQSMHPTGNRTIGYFEAPADSPAVIEFTVRLKKGSYVQISTPRAPYVLRKRDPKELAGVGLGIQWVEFEGPLYDTWPPLGHTRLFGDLPLKQAAPRVPTFTPHSEAPRADAQRLFKSFMNRAYRRPATDDEVAVVVDLAMKYFDEGSSFEESMRVGYKAILCSPDFVFFQERLGPTPERTPADDYALASRLSYFLWNTLPDDELMSVAERGELSKPEVLRSQTERLLKHPKAKNFTRNFTDQWLELRLIDSTTPDKKLYPEFDIRLRESMVQETELFFEEILKHDLSVASFVDSDFSFLNERLAAHYGVPGIEGMGLRRVELPRGVHRGGVMTQASVLKVTANGTSTSPVVRGVWVMKNILGKTPDPPPPNVGAIEPDIRGATTIREELDKHRRVASCAGCHVKIDPYGFALENFDVTGGWRDNYRVLRGPRLDMTKAGPKVEAHYSLADGRSFTDIDGLKLLLLEDKDRLARCLAEKLLIYATGRGLKFADRDVVNEIVARDRAQGYGLRALVHEVVQSPTFLNP